MNTRQQPTQPGRPGYVVEKVKEGVYAIVRTCFLCGNTSTVLVPGQGLWDWEHGMFVQRAFPDLPASLREQVMTGTHPSCWDNAFKEDPNE